MSKICIACGMPMNKPTDHALGDTSLEYCLHCANQDGSMHSYEQKQDSLTNFLVRTQGLDPEAARNATISMMSKLPAWKS